jgi:hypothetical protein
MRITFFILLLANLVLILWQTQIQSADNTQSWPEIPEEQRLVLVSESKDIKEPEEGETDEVSTEAEIPQPDQPEQPDLGLPDIEIISANESREEPDTEPQEVEPQQVCYTMGPFKDSGVARMVTTRLQDLGADVSQRSKVEQEQYGYRVYLKPYATREEAVSESRKLAEHGVRDYYIITDNEDKVNGISLGLFRKKSGAIRRMAQVRRFDFKPHMEIRYRDTTIYWLDYEHRADIDSQPLWRELTEETPELQRLDRDCKANQN